MFPVTVDDLMAISDTGGIMPPKSTWFEPKLRDGLLIHESDASRCPAGQYPEAQDAGLAARDSATKNQGTKHREPEPSWKLEAEADRERSAQ